MSAASNTKSDRRRKRRYGWLHTSSFLEGQIRQSVWWSYPVYRPFGFPAPELSPMGWPLGDPAYEVDRHQAIGHSGDWCGLIAVVLHEAAVPVSASSRRV
jgi:hypothetical protein